MAKNNPTLSSLSVSPSSVVGGLQSSTGTVTLSGPAPAGGAQVTLSSSNTNVARVPASVTVTAGGFQTLVQQKLVVDALSTVGLNLALKIGAANEQVTVTDTLPALNTSDGQVAWRVELQFSSKSRLSFAREDPSRVDPVAHLVSLGAVDSLANQPIQHLR